MTDTLFADVSEFQRDVDNRYPYHFFSFRSNDGTYRDKHFAANLAWAKQAVTDGRLTGFLVYFVFEPNWQETLATFKSMVGTPHRKMAVMIDVESWAGKIKGDHSAQINALREYLITWLQAGNRRRVVGYGNAHDLDTLWPHRGDVSVVLANYSANPDFPGKIAHQFSSRFNVPPFGACDINSADGFDPVRFAGVLGLNPVTVPTRSFAGNSLEAVVALDRSSIDYKNLLEDLADAVWGRIVNLKDPAEDASAARVLSSIHRTVHADFVLDSPPAPPAAPASK